MAQPRLPGTLPSPAEARKAHREACKAERMCEEEIEGLQEGIRSARLALKAARKARRTAEDDLDAIDEGRRPG